MSTNNGLVRSPFDRILNYSSKTAAIIPYTYFGEDEGIINPEFNGGCSPPYIALSNGYVSYPTMDGLVWFRPESVQTNLPDNKVFVDDIQIDGVTFKFSEQLKVPAYHDSIVFNLSTPYYGNPDNLYLQYQLEGFNKDWVTLNGRELVIRFNNLPSGSYNLKIRNLLDRRSIAAPELSITLNVEKMFFETTWFRVLAVLVISIVLFIMIKLNNARIIRKNQDLEEKIHERTQELQQANVKLKDNLQILEDQEKVLKESIRLKDRLISVISHDIITPLKFISMVSRHSKRNAANEPGVYAETMKDIEFASDKLYNNASNILNWIKVQNHNITPVKNLIALYDLIVECTEPIQGMAEIKNLKLVNEVPEEMIIRSDRNILSIILYNLLTNAVKYTENGVIRLSSRNDHNHCFIEISDSGIGMTPKTINYIQNILDGKTNEEKPEDDDDFGNRLGYYIIADLLKYIDGNISISSVHGEGTTITLSIENDIPEEEE